MHEIRMGGPYSVALSFLSGRGKFGQLFTFRMRLGEGQMMFPGGYVLIGAPTTQTSEFRSVLFYIDANFHVRRVMIVDDQGNRNVFDFMNERVNTPVSMADFTFTPPAGTTIVHLQ